MAKSFSEFPVVETAHVEPGAFSNRGSVNPAIRGRFAPPPERDVLQLAISIKENGQQQAIIARKSGDELHILEGFTRVEAIQKIREGFEYVRDDGSKREIKPDESFLVRVSVVDCDDETATVLNITGNSQRSNLSCMDKAANVGRLAEMKDAKGKGLYSGKAIADMLRINPTDVSRLKGLLELPDCAKERLHDGRIPYSVGIELAKESNKFDEKVITALVLTPRKDSDGNPRDLNLQDIREYLRDRDKDTPKEPTETTEGEETPTPATATARASSTGMTKNEILKFLESRVAETKTDEDESDARAFLNSVLTKLATVIATGAMETFIRQTNALVNKLDAKIVKSTK